MAQSARVFAEAGEYIDGQLAFDQALPGFETLTWEGKVDVATAAAWMESRRGYARALTSKMTEEAKGINTRVADLNKISSSH